MSQYANYIFTSYADELKFDESRLKFYVYQREVCPDTGRLHWQGYCGFTRSVRLQVAQRAIGDPAAHMERRLGSHQQAMEYCTKLASRAPGCEPVKWGQLELNQGKRTDLDTFTEAMVAGTPLVDLIEEQPSTFVKFSKGLYALDAVLKQKKVVDFRKLTVTVLYGDAGTGKTRYAARDPDSYILADPDGGRIWFDGYNGQATLIIDDFYGWIKHYTLLRILDGYKYKIEVKGAHTWANWTNVIITSNVHPSEWYTCKPWNSDMPLQRRINIIFKCSTTLFGFNFHCEKGDQMDINFDRQFDVIPREPSIRPARRPNFFDDEEVRRILNE